MSASPRAGTDVVLLWHMHQPDYRDPSTGVALLPWVRLHAASAYRDMARALEEAPEVHVTVNFVPSLVAQLEAVAAGAPDSDEDLAAKPTADLDPAEREAILARFFSVHWGRQLETRPRFRELLERRRQTPSLHDAAARFSPRDLNDLEVLFHLAWLGFTVREEEPWVAELERKGSGFSEEEKRAVLDLVRAQAAKVLPAWRALAARGQVELSSSPYYHPIIPLLIDSDSARRAMPERPLPTRFAFPEDARAQILRGRQAHERYFGAPPAGMWPPEGSVSPEAVALYGELGTRWLASDEEVLFQSLGSSERAQLATPYRFGKVTLVFRDRVLSDRIGFSYSSTPAEAAVADFLERARTHEGMACVILDGENAWEAYEQRGRPFLRGLYRGLATSDGIRTRTVSEALESHPARHLGRLHSGSWIDGRFAIWIGDPEKNRAWEALGQARGTCGHSEKAVEHLAVAEGSDWFWWYGEPFSSAEDALFDHLFRARLSAAYRAAGEAPPAGLDMPLSRGLPKPALLPHQFIQPRLDGLVTSFFEWQGAGSWDVPRGTVMGEAQPLLKAIHYGFDRDHLYLRLDPWPSAGGDPMQALRGKIVRVVLRAGERQINVLVDVDTVNLPLVTEVLPEPKELGRGDGFARLEILELAAPFAVLRLEPRQQVEMVIQLEAKGISLGRYPRDGALIFTVPAESFEAENWSA